MIDKISKFILNCFLKNLKTKKTKKQKELYEYGIGIILSSILNIILVLLCGLIFKDIIAALIFLVVIISLRQFCGGYHAKTYFMCNFWFVFSFLSVFLLSKMTERFISVDYLFIVIICAFFPIYAFSPIENSNKPINVNNKEKLRNISSVIYILFSLASLFVIIISKTYAAVTAYTLVCVSVLMVVEIIMKGGGKK